MLNLIERTLLIGLSSLVAVGCAGTPEADTVGGENLIIVDNANAATAPMTVYLVPETGVRTELGVINPNEETRFNVDPGPGLRYHLLATQGTEELVSPEFTFTGNTAVEWEIRTNTIGYPDSNG